MDKPWGEVRYSWTSTPVTTPSYALSKYTFTGQYSYMDDPTTSGVSEGIGLMFYNARMYDPALGRFTSADSIVPGGVQGYDRYAYTANNPVNYTDPSGHVYCGLGLQCGEGEVNGGSPTTPPLGGNSSGGGGGNDDNGEPSPSAGNQDFSGFGEPSIDYVPPCGQSGYYSSACSGWHEYRVENVVCPAWLHCTEEKMIDYMLRFAYPNQNPSQPAIRGEYTVGIPIIGLDLGMMGPIFFTSSNDGLTTTNTTLETHILYDGQVVRTASQNDNGDWVVTTQGYGNNTIFGMDVANEVGGPILFNTVDAQMTAYIVIDQLFVP